MGFQADVDSSAGEGARLISRSGVGTARPPAVESWLGDTSGPVLLVPHLPHNPFPRTTDGRTVRGDDLAAGRRSRHQALAGAFGVEHHPGEPSRLSPGTAANERRAPGSIPSATSSNTNKGKVDYEIGAPKGAGHRVGAQCRLTPKAQRSKGTTPTPQHQPPAQTDPRQ